MIRPGNINGFAWIVSFDPFGGDRNAELIGGRSLVAVEGERVVGYVTFSRDGFIGRPFVHLLAVDAAYRRRGIAGGLLAAVETAVWSAAFRPAAINDERRVALALSCEYRERG